MTLQFQEESQREMLERVGILPKTKKFPPEIMIPDTNIKLLLNFVQKLSLSTMPVMDDKNTLRIALKRIEDLEKAFQELKKEKEIRIVPSKVDSIYARFKDQLEKEHFGQIVAIDVGSEKIAGCGNSILEAYQDAMRNQKTKKQFAYRRVGFDFVHRL